MSDDRQHRIRQRAHAIWESHGRPHGHDRDHWDQATREIEAEDAAAAKKKPASAAAARKPKTATSRPKAPSKTPAKKPAKAKAT